MNAKSAAVAAGLLVALLATGLRAVDLTADPPTSIEIHAPFSIEGQIVHNARNRVLFGSWVTDQWDLTALAAGPTLFSTASFTALGTSLASARAPSIALSFLSLLLFHAILIRGFGARTALLGSLLLATNYAAAMIMRLALPATSVVFFVLLAVWCWGWAARPRAGAALAGAASIGAAASDATGIVAVFAGLIVSILVRLHAWKMTWLGETRARIRSYWIGAGAMLLVWIAVFVAPHWETTRATFPHMNPFVRDARHLGFAAFFAPHELGGIFRFFPVIVLVIAVYALFLSREVMRLIARHRPVPPEKLWLFSWLLAGLLLVGVLQSRPVRTLLFLIPPMTAFAAEGLLKLARLRRIERIEIGFPVFFFWETTVVWFGVQWAFRSWLNRPGAAVPDFFVQHANRWEFAVVTLLSLLISFTAVLAYRRWRRARFGIPVPRPLVLGVVIAAFAAAFTGDLIQYGRWKRDARHSVHDAQAAIAALPEEGAVAGTWAPLLALPSRHRALMWREGMNEAPLGPMRVRWLVLEKGALEEIGRNRLVARFEPDLARSAPPRATFRLGVHEVELFEVAAPRP